MELEEMKSLWTTMSDKMNQQKLLTDKIVLEMIEQKYKGELTKIYNFEMLATIICLIALLLVILNLGKLDTIFYQLSALVLAVLYIMPFFMTLKTIKKMKSIQIGSHSLKDVLIEFTRLKQKFFYQQKIYMVGGLLSVVVGLPILGKIIGKDFTWVTDNWLFWIPVAIVTVLISGFMSSGYYSKGLSSAESILKEMDVE